MPPAAEAVQAKTGKTAGPGEAPAQTASTGSGRITELRVSANLMSLDTGVYCVFPAVGSPSPDPMTGLPGVRVTRCPGMAGRPEAVSISTFRDDGWIDNTAALVRVTDGPAQVLVTIYQAAGQPAETAPRLQVLRLSADPSAPAASPEAATAPMPEIMAHIQGAGDVPGSFGEWIGKKGSGSWVEGFGISDKSPIPAGELEYQAVLGKGWLSPWVDNGKFCGSRGMALPLLGINLRLKGEMAREHTLRYSATFVDGSTAGPVEEGTPCEAASLAALESFMVELRPKGAARQAPAKTQARTGRR